MFNNAISASSSHIRGAIAMFSQLLYCNVLARKMTRNSYCFSPRIDRSNQDRVNSAARKDWRTNKLSSYLFQEAFWRTVYTDITISRRELETRLFCRDLLPWPLYWFPDEESFDGNFLRWLMSTMEASVKPLSIVSQTYLSKFFFPWEANQFSCDFFHWYIYGFLWYTYRRTPSMFPSSRLSELKWDWDTEILSKLKEALRHWYPLFICNLTPCQSNW